MARSAAEHQPRGIHLERRTVLKASGLVISVVAGGEATRRILFSGLKNGEGTTPVSDGGFPRPEDQGVADLTADQRKLLQRNFAEIRPDILRPQANTSYIDGGLNSYLFYTRGVRVNFDRDHDKNDTVKRIRYLDNSLRDMAAALSADQTLGFKIVPRPETNNIVVIEPSHFPLPGNSSPAPKAEIAEWDSRQDPLTGEFVGVVRLPDKPGKIEDKQEAQNIAFNAVSAAKAMSFEGGVLSRNRMREILEILGRVPFARVYGQSYEEFKSENGWAPPIAIYESVPDDVLPVLSP